MTLGQLNSIFSPITRLFGSQQDSPDCPGASSSSLKRKRSQEPRCGPNDPIYVDSDEDELVADSEEERDEVRMRGTYGVPRSPSPRSTRRRTESSRSSDGQSHRAPPTSANSDAHAPVSLRFQPNNFTTEQALSSTCGDDSRPPGSDHYNLDDRIRELEEAVKSYKDEIRSLRRDLSARQQLKVELQERCSRLERDLSKADDHSKQALRKIKELEGQRSTMEAQLTRTKTLLQTRTDELSLAQAFMTTADKFSVAEVVRMVEQLNDDFYQLAALLSDMLLPRDKKPGDPSKASAGGESRKKVTERYGEELTAKLLVDLDQDDTILFECLVQEICAECCQRLIKAICPTSEAVDKTLRVAWERLVQSQEMSIAKNWLAMTSSQMKLNKIDPMFAARLLLPLMDICGWRNEGPSGLIFPESVLDRLSDILGKANNIREMVFESILSTEVEVIRTMKPQNFTPRWMRDAFEVGKSATAREAPMETAICTTGLGVSCVKRVASASHPSKKEKQHDIILKCKVLLASTLTTPPPPNFA